jgi:enoyl-CoA hydratase
MSETYPDYEMVQVDFPARGLLRITLNRPEKRNAMNNHLRGELFDALIRADQDNDIQVMIIRGAGSCFSAGYDLTANLHGDQPFYTAGGMGNWPRHVTEGCFRIWDMSKPVIAQVHGYCLAGGSELASACDLIYVADSARIGYPPVRSISPPDNQIFPWVVGMRRSMEMMLTGDAITGEEAVEYGFANRCFSEDELEDKVLEMASRVASIPADIQQINKRAVHRQMDAMGIRAGIRAGTEMQMLASLTPSTQQYYAEMQKGLTAALTKRDEQFGDYRTKKD